MDITTSILASSRAWLIAAIVSLGIQSPVAAETEIHKCTDADGGIVYSQLPCAPEKPASQETAEEESPPEVRETDTFTYDDFAADPREQAQRSAEEIAACKKRYRDAIDVIDAEIARDYSAEQADTYKQRLLELTRQLRRC